MTIRLVRQGLPGLLAASALLVGLSACASKAVETPAPAPAIAPAPPAPAAPPTQPAAQPAPVPAQTASSRTDYDKPENWLCRPGIANNACDVNMDATIVSADGSTKLETFKADPNAPIDCFYIYPTVSLDPFTQSDLIAGPEELSVVKTQFARFGAKCRLFAPMYRQFSLGALRARMSGGAAVPTRGSPLDAVQDVDDAWAWYLANENKGRGVVLVGHSQGSGQLIRMISAHVDGQPAQAKLVSAIILGGSVQVPKGKDVGGAFKSIPACHAPDQTGCVISYSTFRDTLPPAATAMFGQGRNGDEVVCTNPAAMGGGLAKTPKAYWTTGAKEWAKGKKIDTPFVVTPGLFTTECVQEGDHTYLKVHLKADPADPRIDDPLTDIPGADGKPDPNWGLHLVDANVGMGDLVDVVGKQAAAWKKTHP